MPYLQAIWKEHFFAIGGFDETFTAAICGQDNDYRDRILRYGCKLIYTEARCVHLKHEPWLTSDEFNKRRKVGVDLWKLNQAYNVIVVNEDIEWGKFDDCTI